MNLNYLIPCGCALGGGLIYRHFYDMYLGSFNYKNENRRYALMTYQHYDNLYNSGMFYGLTLGLSYILFKKYSNHHLINIKPNFS